MAKKQKKKIVFPYEYDPRLRKKAKVYFRIKIMAGVVNGMIIPILFLLAFYLLGFSFQLKSLVGETAFIVPLFIFGVLVILDFIALPLRFYFGYVYEHKYKLSRHTKKSWFKDYLKGLGIGYVFSVPILSFVYFLMGFSYWWVYAALVYFFLDVFLDTIWPVLILPLFYKLKPFENQRLRKKLLEMVKQAGSKNIKEVLVAKESDKSVKANAMFGGLGKTKKIILFDTLLDNFTEDEIETVIGHELGHYVNKDIPKGIILSTVLLFPLLFIIHLILSSAPGLDGINDIAGFPLFLASFDLLGLLFMPLENWYTRRRETAADWFGLEHSRKPEAQISIEKRLADQALSDVNPHPLVEFILFSHPNANKRIAMVEEWKKRKGLGRIRKQKR